MGPPPRSFAADAHCCIMVRVLGPTVYKVVARLKRAPERELPSDRHPDRIERAAALGAVKVWPAGARRVEGLVRRPTLTAPARAGFAILRVGTEKRDSRSNKETDQESKKDRRTRNRLTTKTPYKVRRGQRLGRHFWPHWPIPGGRDRAIPCLWAAKPRKVKDYSRKPELPIPSGLERIRDYRSRFSRLRFDGSKVWDACQIYRSCISGTEIFT
jgi:hypothetical protein